MVRNNPWKAYHSLMLSCLMLLQVVNSKHRTIRNQSGKTEPPNSNGDEPMHSYRWEEETGVEIPASKSTVLRGHESEVFICLRLNPTTFRRVELKFRATKMSPHLTAGLLSYKGTGGIFEVCWNSRGDKVGASAFDGSVFAGITEEKF
ncbi:hypothetical protein DAPPUDRAFT_334194 [Daphnia pulex]|uniref:Uncharacterized protein n=1 Tax=Daphnia pulex TaxID=6669 RepID=E9HUZ3_DAPPU|nr:hypothetical protein DAPPUDRAFT_334194 [Daphnia pulex]|eukprot:EFX64441.1 hypothetical protein DAPPUDRAFT_334194 [Daphnia pulex]